MRAGESINRYLIGTTPGRLALADGDLLEIELSLNDQFGEQYCFPLSLLHRQLPIVVGPEYSSSVKLGDPKRPVSPSVEEKSEAL
jgi:hypothetical protein